MTVTTSKAKYEKFKGEAFESVERLKYFSRIYLGLFVVLTGFLVLTIIKYKSEKKIPTQSHSFLGVVLLIVEAFEMVNCALYIGLALFLSRATKV